MATRYWISGSVPGRASSKQRPSDDPLQTSNRQLQPQPQPQVQQQQLQPQQLQPPQRGPVRLPSKQSQGRRPEPRHTWPGAAPGPQHPHAEAANLQAALASSNLNRHQPDSQFGVALGSRPSGSSFKSSQAGQEQRFQYDANPPFGQASDTASLLLSNAAGRDGPGISPSANHRPPPLGQHTHGRGQDKFGEGHGHGSPSPSVQQRSPSGVRRYQQLSDEEDAPPIPSVPGRWTKRHRSATGLTSSSADGFSVGGKEADSDIERGGLRKTRGGTRVHPRHAHADGTSHPDSPIRAHVFGFFHGLLDAAQFEAPLPQWLSSPPLPLGPMPEFQVRVPLRLWRGNQAALAADGEDAMPPVRLVRVPMASAVGDMAEETVRRCFNADVNGRVSLEDLAAAPARIAAVLRDAGVSSHCLSKEFHSTGHPASTEGGALAVKKVPSTHRVREAVGGPSQQPDWDDLVDILEAPGSTPVAPVDLVGLAPTDASGKVPLEELVEAVGDFASAPSSPQSNSGPTGTPAGAGVHLSSPSNFGKALPPSPSGRSAHSDSIGKALRVFQPKVGASGETSRGKAGDEVVLGGRTHPWYIFFQTGIALTLWVVCGLAGRKDFSWVTAKAGLESIFPDRTSLRIHMDCADLRPQFIWRCWTYQFTHVGLSHIALNVLMNLILGIPLEEFHGTLRIAVMYNIGIFGGACCAIVSDVHSEIVGMSGGCYALLGMHLADLIMNWQQRTHHALKLTLLFVLVVYDIVSAVLTANAAISHATHFGGYVAGLIIAIVMGRNVKVYRWERHLQYVAAGVGVVLVLFSMCWSLAQWPPREIWEDHGWCTTFQVSNSMMFGDNSWHCVRCDSEQCAEAWSSKQYYVAPVTKRACELRGGWSVSER